MGNDQTETKCYPIPRVFCGAKTRSGSGVPCRQPAMPNGKCRLHGGKSRSGPAHGGYKHGYCSEEYKELKRQFRRDMTRMKEILAMC